MGQVRERTTLAAVARATGLSLATVSKVLNGRAGISDENRRKVEAALLDHGYVRRHRSGIPGAPRYIDLVMAGLDGSWPATVLSAVEATAYEHRLHVVVSTSRDGEAFTNGRRRDWSEVLVERGSSGVLLGLVDLTVAQRARLERAGVPVVLIHPLSDPPTGVASVGANTWTGAYDATLHLIGLGHRRIALVTGPDKQLSEQARIGGFRSAMTSAGLEVPPGFVCHGTYDRASGKRLVSELVRLPERPTAVFVCSDHMAIGGYEALAQAGLRVPDDISVVGFDDLPEARWVYPPLTTVRQPLKDMGRAAVELLLRLMNGDEVSSRRVEFATTLIVRQSARALEQQPLKGRARPRERRLRS